MKSWLRAPAGVLLAAVLVPLLNVLPTLHGYMRQEPDKSFLGFRHMAGDHYQYASMVRQTSEEGRLFYENRFTTEPQRGSYVFLYFWLLGMLDRLTRLGLVPLWEVMRVVIGFASLMAIWRFLALVFEDRGTRLLAYFFVAFGGGLSWIAGIVPDSAFTRPGFPGVTDPVNYQWNWSTFGTMLVPLWILPILLLVLAGMVFARQVEAAAPARWVAGLAIGPAIWFSHPHSGNAAYLTFGLFSILPALEALWRIERIPWNALRRQFACGLPFLASFGVVLLYLRWAKQDPVFDAVSRTAFLWSPSYSVFLYPITYGLLLPLGLLGVRWCGSLPERPRRFLLAWLASAFILSVNPWWAGSKHQFMLFPPLAILAAHGFSELRRRSPAVMKTVQGWTAALLGSFIFLNAPLSILKDLPRTDGQNECFITSANAEALEFLDQQAPGAVLSGPKIGNLIPWKCRKTVFVGHWLLTVSAASKEKELISFLDSRSPVETKQALLDKYGIRYIYYGPVERLQGPIDPSLSLAVIYDRDGVTIYEVP